MAWQGAGAVTAGVVRPDAGAQKAPPRAARPAMATRLRFSASQFRSIAALFSTIATFPQLAGGWIVTRCWEEVDQRRAAKSARLLKRLRYFLFVSTRSAAFIHTPASRWLERRNAAAFLPYERPITRGIQGLPQRGEVAIVRPVRLRHSGTSRFTLLSVPPD